MGKTVALYGGGFKPPTRGHFEVVKTALDKLDIFLDTKISFETKRGSLSSLTPKFFLSKITLTSEAIISFFLVST